MELAPRGFHAKLIVLLVTGLLVLQLVTLGAVHLAGRRAVRLAVSEELQVGDRVLRQELAAKAGQLREKAEVLTADFAFREVIASGDRPTIASVLANHGDRIDADAVFLVSLSGTVEAETLGGRFVDSPFPLPELLQRVAAGSSASQIALFEHRLHQFVVVPVLAPWPIAYVAIGFEIDDAQLEEVSRLIAMHVSLVGPPNGSLVLASTLPVVGRRQLVEWLADRLPAAGRADPEPATVMMTGESYALTLEPLTDAGEIGVVLQRSIEEAREPFRQLELQIFGLSSAALVACLVAASVLARGLSGPLLRLAEGAQRIGSGDYSSSIEATGGGELGQLAGAFNLMRDGIRAREQHIRYQATHDDLTGLPNRTLFQDRLEHAIDQAHRRGTMVGLAMMDLDRFKEINDTLGHHVGDQLLIEISQRLSTILRESDTIARLGGDEFGLLFETDDPAHAVDVATRVAKVLENAFPLDDLRIEVNASLGISLYPLHAEDAASLMKRADVAMYDAKRNHLLVALYEPDRDDHSRRRLSILSELRQAISDDDLEAHYQPVIDVATGRVVQAEALVRWSHRTHGLMPPDEFIPQAEQSGNIGLLTRWMLARAIGDCAGWMRQGLDLSVAVNLSALDLYDSELPGVIGELLHGCSLPPSRLILEITESALMRDAERATKILSELRDSGSVIAMDDFGTGYSSLAVLRRLPVDELKIDRSFVKELVANSSEDQVIVRSTIELGHNMGLTVVAEGVESAQELRLLAALGCDLAQGYHLSRPLPVERFHDWLVDS